MSNFANCLRNESYKTRTENGALALNNTGDTLLNFFAIAGALRDSDNKRIETLFAEAFKEDPLLATKIIFYARDVRGGLGERKVFRTLLKYAAIHHKEAVIPNIALIGLYGRFDDLYSLVGTPCEDAMWIIVKMQLAEDIKNMSENKPVSLLAKWLKTADASSDNTRKLGIYTAQKLGYKVYNYKRILRSLRKYIKVTEGLMSTQQWDKIDYSIVPSKAMKLYKNAFQKHDESRFEDYISKVESGEAKINASTLYPYDIVAEAWKLRDPKNLSVLEAQWKALPNYIFEGVNAIVMADTSGSMMCSNGRPFYTAVSLAVYFAERNSGKYKDLWMSFSSNPNIHTLKGETLRQKLESIDTRDWGCSTNLGLALAKILDIAITNNLRDDDLPKALIVISDMEVDDAFRNTDYDFYTAAKRMYGASGYTIPNIIFWNVNSRHDTYLAQCDVRGVQYFSGQSASTFKNVIDCIDNMTPYEAMLKVLNSERYEPITLL